MNGFRYFLLGLAVTFGLPWYVMVVRPYVAISQLEPVAYNPDVDDAEGTFPGGGGAGREMGRAVYKREGCVNCHTQVIRPQYASGDGDGFKQAFGKTAGEGAVEYTRETTPYDFIGDDVALIGQVRNGPDLSNIGFRQPDENWHYRHLYNPQGVNSWSTMPGQRHLFNRRVVQGAPSDNAVLITLEDGITTEVVPTSDAEALVDYLLTLKHQEPVPASLSKGGAPAGGGDQG
ncbi:MAG: cbb3-type cytochrome c oxidase subunit II, partial [Verrucomicrobiales bacterium]|nr:cbb3-type cytochrome c oxidase subunit II [Verrucomicrobiales bacterium]